MAVVAAAGCTREQVLSLAAALQRSSEHPLARAVLDKVQAEGLAVPDAADAQALPGRGLQARVNGQRLLLGSGRLLREQGLDAGALAADAQRLEADGRTVSWLMRQDGETTQLLGLLAFGDGLKAAARDAVARLHQLGITSVMLTGDNRRQRRMGGARAGHRRLPRRGAAWRQGGHRAGAAQRRQDGGDGRRRHQRRAGAGRGRRGHRHVHRHRRGDGGGRHHA